MSRPGYHVDVATTAIPAAIAQPPGGIQTAGFPAHSKFASAWANWLFNFLGAWTRELDQSCLRAIDMLSTTSPQIMNGDVGILLPIGSGLLNLVAENGGVYVLFGRRVDLSLAGILDKYPTGWTLPNNSTVYAHAREETAAGGSSTGELLFSTNASEAGYQAIWTGTTDATDLTSQANLAETSAQWTLPVDFTGPITITDANDETALVITTSNTLAPGVSIDATAGGGTGLQVFGGPASSGVEASLTGGAGQTFNATIFSGVANSAGFRASLDGASDGWGLDVAHAGAGYCARLVATGSAGGLSVATVSGTGIAVTGGASSGITVTPAATGYGMRVNAGANNGMHGMTVDVPNGNTAGSAIVASTGNAAGTGGRAVEATAYASGIAIEGTAVNNNAGKFTTTGATTGVSITAANGVGLDVSSTGTGANGNYAASFSGDATSPVKGVIYMTPQNADPSGGGVSGAVGMSTAKGMTLGNFADGTWRSVWHSEHGYACAFASLYGYGALGLTIPNATFTAVAVIATANSGDQIKVASSTILLRLSFSMKSNSVAESFMSIRVEDTTAGGTTVWTRAGTGSADTAGYVVPANTATAFWVPGPTIEFAVVVPLTGTRSYTVKMAAPTVVPFRIRDLTVAFVGTVA